LAAIAIMQYALGPLREPSGRLIVDIEAPMPEGSGAEAAGLVTGRLELDNAGTGISARGHFRVPVLLECSRCVCAFVEVLEIEVNEDCALKELDEPESYAESVDDLGQIPILNGRDLDLSELVRQLVAMHLPPRPLCKDDCAGLCPRCGQDLNQQPCSCSGQSGDPRWDALRDLKL
jgi:uncharacterized protein